MRADDIRDLTLQTIVAELLHGVPEFRPDRTDIRDNITYLVFNDLVEFVLGLRPDADESTIQRVFSFLEQASERPDKEVQMLLRDVAWAMAAHSNLTEFERFMGPNVRKLIRQSPAGGVLKR